MRKLLLSLVPVASLCIAAAGGWYWWTEARFHVSTDNAYIESDISIVSPKIAGYVREIRVADNQQVKAGDILVTIDDEDAAASVAQAKAAVEASRAAIASVDREIELQGTLIEQAGANIASAEAELNRARPNYERYRKMVASNIVARKDYDTAEADLLKAEAEVTRARKAQAAERGRLPVQEAARKEREADLLKAEAALTIEQINLANTVIRAPVDGVVGAKGVEVGQYVKVGTQLMAIVPLPQTFVVANFKETQLENIRPGQPVEIEVDAFPAQSLHGMVESFAPASGAVFSLLPPENATGNFTKVVQRVPIRIALPADNPLAGLLRPGLSVVVTIDTRAPGNASALAGGIFGAAQAATAGD